MPKKVTKEVGKIYRSYEVKTFGDKVKEFLEGIAAIVLVIVVLGAIFGG